MHDVTEKLSKVILTLLLCMAGLNLKKEHEEYQRMKSLPSLSIPVFAIFSLCITATMASSPAIIWSKPNCSDKCGDVHIPYPFGITSECSINSSFLIDCQNSTKPEKPFLQSIQLEVLSISLEGTVTVKQPISPMNCTGEQQTVSLGRSLVGSPFTISSHRNTFAVLGCKNSVLFQLNSTSSAVGGCIPICDDNYKSTSCDGVNCCQIRISQAQELRYTYQSVRPSSTKSCGYAFPVDKAWFEEGYGLYRGLRSNLSNPFDEEFVYVPLVLEWELANPYQYITFNAYCTYRDRYLGVSPYVGMSSYCTAQCRRYLSWQDSNSYGYESSSRYCRCGYGFEGNPYLPGGCVDIDECSNSTLNGCGKATCINEIGRYTCRHPKHRKSQITKITLISIGSVLGAVVSLIGLIGAFKSTKIAIKRFKAYHRRILFKRNGGLLLEQHLSSTENGYKKTKLFGSKELSRATDRYNENRVLGRGGQGTVYKGMLTDGRIVAVKKSQKVDEGDLEVFINEVVILSQVNHRNVVKLLGCCLETEVPLLVYEFIPNGTLFQHIHDPNEDFTLSWDIRVRIATEIAQALSYLHSAASAPIYHRDIKSTNILLDDKYRAKISDFGTSRSVSMDKTHLTTRVLGTFGYLDPEYFQSSQFTEKSDVYSFGVVMVELLTGEKAVSTLRAETGRSLATYFLHSMEENKLFDIVDMRILEEGKEEEIKLFAELARKCLHLHGKSRPTMKEVAAELESIQIKKSSSVWQQKHGSNSKGNHSVDYGDTYDFSLISGSSTDFDFTSTSTTYYSSEHHM